MPKVTLSGSNNIPILGTGTTYETRYRYKGAYQQIVDFSRKYREDDITTGDASLAVPHTNPNIQTKTWNDGLFQWAITKNYLYGKNYVAWGLGFKNTEDYFTQVGLNGYWFWNYQRNNNWAVQNNGFLWDGDVNVVKSTTTIPSDASVFKLNMSVNGGLNLYDDSCTWNESSNLLTINYRINGNTYGRKALNISAEDISASYNRTALVDREFTEQQKNLIYVYLSQFPNFTDIQWIDDTNSFKRPWLTGNITVVQGIVVKSASWTESASSSNLNLHIALPYQQPPLKIKTNSLGWFGYNLINPSYNRDLVVDYASATMVEGATIKPSNYITIYPYTGDIYIYHNIYIQSPLNLSLQGFNSNNEKEVYSYAAQTFTKEVSQAGRTWRILVNGTVHIILKANIVQLTDYWEYYWVPTTGSDGHAPIIQPTIGGIIVHLNGRDNSGNYLCTYVGNSGCAARMVDGHKTNVVFDFTVPVSGNFLVVWGNGDVKTVVIPSSAVVGQDFTINYTYPD